MLDMNEDDQPKIGLASLTITAWPWASCSVDGKLMGVARIVTAVRPGVRKITCEHKGKKQTKKIHLSDTEKRRVHFKF